MSISINHEYLAQLKAENRRLQEALDAAEETKKQIIYACGVSMGTLKAIAFLAGAKADDLNGGDG